MESSLSATVLGPESVSMPSVAHFDLGLTAAGPFKIDGGGGKILIPRK